jgi:hypothetical protein
MEENYKLISYDDTQSEKQCSICFNEFHKDTEVYQTSCMHIFCRTCLDTWLNNENNCPMCRKELISKKKMIIYLVDINGIPFTFDTSDDTDSIWEDEHQEVGSENEDNEGEINPSYILDQILENRFE